MLIRYKGMGSTRALRQQKKERKEEEEEEEDEDEEWRIFTAHSSLPSCIDVPR